MKNIGRTLMRLGKTEFVLGILCLIGAAIAFFNYEEEAFIILISIGVTTILSSLPIIGFGQLVDDVHEIRHNLESK